MSTKIKINNIIEKIENENDEFKYEKIKEILEITLKFIKRKKLLGHQLV